MKISIFEKRINCLIHQVKSRGLAITPQFQIHLGNDLKYYLPRGPYASPLDLPLEGTVSITGGDFITDLAKVLNASYNELDGFRLGWTGDLHYNPASVEYYKMGINLRRKLF